MLFVVSSVRGFEHYRNMWPWSGYDDPVVSERFVRWIIRHGTHGHPVVISAFVYSIVQAGLELLPEGSCINLFRAGFGEVGVVFLGSWLRCVTWLLLEVVRPSCHLRAVVSEKLVGGQGAHLRSPSSMSVDGPERGLGNGLAVAGFSGVFTNHCLFLSGLVGGHDFLEQLESVM